MESTRQETLIQSITVLLVAIAALLVLMLSPVRFTFLGAAAGIFLLLLCFASARNDQSWTRRERLASSATRALCLLLPLGWLFDVLARIMYFPIIRFPLIGGVSVSPDRDFMLVIFWVILTLVWLRVEHSVS